jgi:hypothetical protein
MIEPYTEKMYGVLPARVDFLKELYKLPENKCELLVMGADDEFVLSAANSDTKKRTREKYNIDEDDFLVVTGGKIDEWKTQTTLLMDAVKQINNNHLKLIVFGSIIPKLKEEIMSRCDDRITYIGWLSVEDTYDLIATADLAAYPGRHSTLWEQTAGQGIPMIVKFWEGTRHVDLGGNVEFLYEDTQNEIYNKLKEIIGTAKYDNMKHIAQENANSFCYSAIARESIGSDGYKKQ